jgi:hypothetical protein
LEKADYFWDRLFILHNISEGGNLKVGMIVVMPLQKLPNLHIVFCAIQALDHLSVVMAVSVRAVWKVYFDNVIDAGVVQ